MTTEKERSQFVSKLFLAILFTVLITVYNSVYNNELISFDTKHLKMLAIRKTSASNASRVNVTNVTNVRTKTILNVTQPPTVRPIPKGYLVWSDNCHMPSMDPMASHYQHKYAEQLLKHFDVGPKCSDKQRFITKYFNHSSKSYILHINMDLKTQYANISNDIDVNCCYRKIIRKGDKSYKLLDCKHFEQDFIVPQDIEYMTIECSNTLNKTHQFYKDAMSFIQERTNVNEKILNNTRNGKRSFGILLFGIDTVSQFNFRRVMPKTFEYVQNNSWFELSGYNKVNI